MGKAKSKIYTCTGDTGLTSLVGGKRVSKDDARLNAYGTIDELNSWIGLIATSNALLEEQKSELQIIQNILFEVCSRLATEPESKWQSVPFSITNVAYIEKCIDLLNEQLAPLNRFILPGGHPDAARTHIARTVARRAERLVVTLNSTIPVDSTILQFLNRLSDYLFVLARTINDKSHVNEPFWEKELKLNELIEKR